MVEIAGVLLRVVFWMIRGPTRSRRCGASAASDVDKRQAGRRGGEGARGRGGECCWALAAGGVEAPRPKREMRGAVQLRCWQDQAEEVHPSREGREEGQDLVPGDDGPGVRH